MGWLLLHQITKKETMVCNPFEQSIVLMRKNKMNKADFKEYADQE
jgi:hypothetical protein